MGDIACDAKGPVTTQGMLLLSKYMQQGRCLRLLAEGPWRPTLEPHSLPAAVHTDYTGSQQLHVHS